MSASRPIGARLLQWRILRRAFMGRRLRARGGVLAFHLGAPQRSPAPYELMGLEFRLAAAQQHILMIVVEGGATLRVVKRLSRSILRGDYRKPRSGANLDDRPAAEGASETG